MNRKQRQRAWMIGALLIGLGSAATLTLYGLRQNINLFYTPTQVAEHKVPAYKTFRLGGMVKRGSVKRAQKALDVEFALTDFTNTVSVHYHGILPDLFREGQGIVAQGQVNAQGEFVASEVLAKHDANYMPPEVKAMLKARKKA